MTIKNCETCGCWIYWRSIKTVDEAGNGERLDKLGHCEPWVPYQPRRNSSLANGMTSGDYVCDAWTEPYCPTQQGEPLKK